MVTGECVVRPLDGHQLANQVGSASIGGVIMADPNQLFHLDDRLVVCADFGEKERYSYYRSFAVSVCCRVCFYLR